MNVKTKFSVVYYLAKVYFTLTVLMTYSIVAFSFMGLAIGEHIGATLCLVLLIPHLILFRKVRYLWRYIALRLQKDPYRYYFFPFR